MNIERESQAKARFSTAGNFGLSLDFKTKIAVFKVDRWWKMPVGKEVEIVLDEVQYPNGASGISSCSIDLCQENVIWSLPTDRPPNCVPAFAH